VLPCNYNTYIISPCGPKEFQPIATKFHTSEIRRRSLKTMFMALHKHIMKCIKNAF